MTRKRKHEELEIPPQADSIRAEVCDHCNNVHVCLYDADDVIIAEAILNPDTAQSFMVELADTFKELAQKERRKSN